MEERGEMDKRVRGKEGGREGGRVRGREGAREEGEERGEGREGVVITATCTKLTAMNIPLGP